MWIALFLYAASKDALESGRAGNAFRRSDGVYRARFMKQHVRLAEWIADVNTVVWSRVPQTEEEHAEP